MEGNEISVSAVLIEMEGGGYRANCPELDINSQGADVDEAFTNLKDAVIRHVMETGPERLRLNAVKCLKFKVPVD